MARLLLIVICVTGWACHAKPETAEPVTEPGNAPRPNIVLIMADDLGYGDLSCYGSTFINTPHIDALAKTGIRFTDYHSNGVVCSPTRAALMTGRYPQRTGVEGVITAARHREVGLALEEVTIAEVLRDAGYATAMYGKWHLGYDIKRFGPQLQGFETFEGFVSGNVDYFHKIDQEGHKDWYVGDELKHVDGYVTDLINDRAVDWIAKHKKENKDKPFFLYLAHGAPHYPMQGPDDKGFREVGKKIREVPDNPKPIYKAMIESMDAGIGRVVAELEKQGVRENTVVIFCSDNGQAARYGGSAGPLRGQKGTMYEGGHRVPLVMSGPAHYSGGRTVDYTATGVDLAMTLVGISGRQFPGEIKIDGENLYPVLAGTGKGGPPRTFYWQMGERYAVRYGKWKLVHERNGKTALFNLTDDLGEQRDIADEHPERVKAMTRDFEAWLKQVRTGVNKVSG